MSGEKAEELRKAPQIYFEKAQIAYFQGEPNKLSYNLNVRASKVESVICNQIAYSEQQATRLETNNRFFLERKLTDNDHMVIRSVSKIGPNNTYIVYDAYNLSKDEKRIFTEEEPKEVGTWLTVTWNVRYEYVPDTDTNGNQIIDSTTGLPKLKKVPIGKWPDEGTQVLVEFHTRRELDPTPSLASNKQFVALPAETAARVEAGELIVSFTALSGTLIDK